MMRARPDVRALSLVLGALLLFLCCVVGPGCLPVTRQWSINFSTSAAVPRMGDRLRVEILDASGRLACDDCLREFDLSNFVRAANLEAGVLSMGVVASEAPVRVHARLYRYTTSANADGPNAIDVVAKLPPFTYVNTESGFKITTFPIPFTCFGRTPDLAAGTTCQLDADFNTIEGPEPTLAEGFENTLVPYGSATECTKPVPDGMACVGSGAFLLGDERFEALSFDYPSRPEVAATILVKGALMLDVDEMTVGVARRLVRDGRVTPSGFGSEALLVRSADADALEGACTYLGRDDPANDALPLNCIGRDQAHAVCAALGKRLPFEREWEFAAGNGVDETLYPWGNLEDALLEGIILYDDDRVVCDRAIVGRGREATGESIKCSRGRGPRAGGSARDVTRAGVRNLGGNLSEWVLDEFGFYDEPCWRSGVACVTPSPRLTQVMAPHRGGSWARSPQSAVAVARFATRDGEPSPYVGFRCAVSEDDVP